MSEDELIKIIGRNIKKYRKIYSQTKEEMSITKLSKLTNLSPSHIISLENQNKNSTISIMTLYKIASVLDVPLNKFLEQDNDR